MTGTVVNAGFLVKGFNVVTRVPVLSISDSSDHSDVVCRLDPTLDYQG